MRREGVWAWEAVVNRERAGIGSRHAMVDLLHAPEWDITRGEDGRTHIGLPVNTPAPSSSPR